jgi:hypothetical protein
VHLGKYGKEAVTEALDGKLVARTADGAGAAER